MTGRRPRLGIERISTRPTTEWWNPRMVFGSITSDEVTIDAPAETVWSVYTDIERWATWTASVSAASLHPSGPLRVGTNASIKQPWLPRVEWTVVELDDGRSWAWQNRSPGANTVARHTVTPAPCGGVHVSLSIDQRGLVGRPIGWLLKPLTRRYLRLEAEGLRRHSEACAAEGFPGARPSRPDVDRS